MKTLIKDIIKFLVIGLFIGLLQLLNTALIEENIYSIIQGVRFSDFISATLLLLFVIFLIRFGSMVGKHLMAQNEFLCRISKISIWLVAFLIIFNNDNFNNAITQIVNGILSDLGVYATRSAITNYLTTLEIVLIAIPLLRFFIFFFQNLDGYIDLFFKRTETELKKESVEQITEAEVVFEEKQEDSEEGKEDSTTQ
jgi:hypothetical protein